MPDPFRHYENTALLDLPADPPSPPVSALSVLSGLPGPVYAQDPIRFFSTLLFYSASISASKKTPAGSRYALRVNPSSGNLHPTEFYASSPHGLFHYRVSSHMLEQRAIGDFGGPSFLLTTVPWREAWKYGSRAYRYCLLDAGHAWQALSLSACALGCDAQALGNFADDEIAIRYSLPEDEWPLMQVQLKGAQLASLQQEPVPSPQVTSGVPNKLSPESITYPEITAIHSATKAASSCSELAVTRPICSAPIASVEEGTEFGKVVRSRRSALDFRGGSEEMSFEHLLTILALATRGLAASFLPYSYLDLYAFVHRVRGVDPGLYRYVRESNSLELLRTGDQRVMAAGLSLGQQLAGNSCVTFSMVADLKRATVDAGDRGYRYVHFEAGAVGQRLYIAAEALGLQSTGIGAFYDDLVNEYLGLSTADKQVVYHFACGYAIEDMRLQPTVEEL